MGRVLYNGVLLLALPLGLAALGWRLLTRPEYRHGVGERFGRVRSRESGHPVIWFHAVSVGEVIAIVPLVTAVRAAYPAAELVLSCGTPTGRATAEQRLGSVVNRVIYLAYDLPPLVAPALDAVRPDLLLLVETEIWPNLLGALERRKVPVMLVNGRISRRSFPRYLRVRTLLKPALTGICRYLMQTQRDAGRVRRMGAPPGRIAVTGNIKYDQPTPVVDGAMQSAMRAALGIADDAPVLLAGSTHAGEDLMLAKAWQVLEAEVPGLVLVLALRHPNRAEAVVRELAGLGIAAGRKSLGDCAGKNVVLLDTVGELAAHYALATVAFVGGSLVPVGGHNPLEPAAAGVPVVYGPHVHNFTGPCDALEEAGAARRVADPTELTKALAELLGDGVRRATMGAAGRDVCARNQGAVERVLAEMRPLLDPVVDPGTAPAPVRSGG